MPKIQKNQEIVIILILLQLWTASPFYQSLKVCKFQNDLQDF